MQLLSLLFVSALALSSSAFQHGIGKNRYQPVVKVSSSIGTTSATTAVAPAATQSDVFADQVVAQHNAARAKYGANPVTWNAALYSATQAYANQCQFQHSSGGNYGENLAAGTSTTYGIVDAVSDWMSEASAYDYNQPDFSSATGHFTQVVWKSTTQVACAVANCPAGTIFSQASQYVVCRYTPPGNYIGQFAANVGMPV
ncbi:hypothetical protein K443DRAFT_6115 [Laccaria amethystina LaAM-08-1]|uniref:SCP domain-containing protein n=1 Tax=Laccaria amethystina LaAM-08-1 TaxID=1095629 RepID=A0A0C9WTT1_9AGAR|nr:hypothetical protein K443DRAFT_6115 [Laccaria amethystina LaAM-08-1]